MLERLCNAVLFQIGWLACVLGGNSLWLLLALAVLVIHLGWISSWAVEGRLVLSVVIVGTAVDSVLRAAGVLWALLATTLRHCLQWSARPWWLASALGAVGGAVSYCGGGRLAGVQFPYGELPTLIGIGLLWALLFPLLHAMARRLSH
jgi:hypothetical protein